MRSLFKVGAIASLLYFPTTQSFAECYGDVYSLNAGRGHVGLLTDLQENTKLSGLYTAEAKNRATLLSRTTFSSSAMTYDKDTDRMYYIGATQPSTYYLEGVADVVSSDELKNLDLHAATAKKFQLAYYDFSTKQHGIVGDTKQTFRMAYDPSSKKIYASDNRFLFTIDPTTGVTTQIAEFDQGSRIGGYTNWGDFLFLDGELLLVTNTRTFVVNKETGAFTLKAFHFLDFVTSATLDQNGQVLVSVKNQNVTGNVNSSHLWRVKLSTGEKKYVGLIPVRISALATNTNATHTCYDKTIFPSDMSSKVSGVTVSSANVQEGQTATFTVNFDKATQQGSTTKLKLALTDGTGVAPGDYNNTSVTLTFSDNSTQTVSLSSSGTSITVPTGATSVKAAVATVDDTTQEQDETFTLSAWFYADQSDKKSTSVTIKDNDDAHTLLTNAANTSVSGEGSSGAYYNPAGNCYGQDIRGIRVYIGRVPAGTTLEFWKTGTHLKTFNVPTTGGVFYETPNSTTRRYECGDIAWGRLRSPTGQYYNIKYGQRIKLHYNNAINCSNGCYNRVYN
ncbi:hypothetical protein LRP49_07580 [Enterovibrio sp. ZSDZ35]|uniref:Uncharacterized protein n=1 Tax=Enterovibrio qingdaonensis TaxID=2899818 RepID=A0ABT5QJA5_9GAMM|nr:hypothetical protein [Enterovibrio sp. ZSDZ35]MDD1781062.1 hypothetical protein [Enterovibrio sp. ZSDZ35]